MIIENCSLLGRNTFGIDVSTRYFFEYKTEEDLQTFLQSPLARTNKLLHIGGGSNLLFLSDFDGVILHSGIKGIEKKGRRQVCLFACGSRRSLGRICTILR